MPVLFVAVNITLKTSNQDHFVCEQSQRDALNGKYPTCKIHTKPHPGLKWCIFHILTSEIWIISLISSFCLKFFLISLVYHRNIFGSSLEVFGQSSEIFGYLWNFSEISCSIHVTFWHCQVLEIFRKSSESGQKSLENRQKCPPHQCVYKIKRTLHVISKIWILCSCAKNNISLVCCVHSW